MAKKNREKKLFEAKLGVIDIKLAHSSYFVKFVKPSVNQLT